MRFLYANLIVSLLLVLAFASPVEAAKRAPVGIVFSFDPAVIGNDWSPEEMAEVAAAVVGALQPQLAERFRYWSFHDDPQRPRLLKFLIRPWQSDGALLEVIPWSGGNMGEAIAQATWLEAGDRSTIGFPPPEAAVSELEALLRDKILGDTSNGAKLKDWLQSRVPIGCDATWMEPSVSDSMHITLPLPFEEFSALQKSRFKISARRPGAGREELEAVGLELPAPFPPEVPSPTMMGLGVLAQHHVVGDIRTPIDPGRIARVRVLQLNEIYLVEERPPLAMDSDDWIDE